MGLRVRLWFACLAGAALAGFGSLWVLGTRVQPGTTDPAELLTWLAGVAFAAMLAGLLLALWLDHHIVSHLRGLLRGVHSGRLAELRGLPGSAGWGELSELTEALQSLLSQQRRTSGANEELERNRAQLAALAAAVELWLQRETWQAPAVTDGPVGTLADALGRGLGRRAVVEEQNREAARQVATELAGSLADAQESAEQAERGFVEATAMLTTVRELQRLSGELQNALAAAASPAPAAATAPESGAREAIEALVAASQQSVDAIGRGMLRVHDVSEQVGQLANRATLIAIHVLTSVRREPGTGDEVADELKQLARDVRETTDRTARFAQDIDVAVEEAAAHMRESRELAFARLQPPAAPPAPSGAQAGALDDAQRLLERVREMVQDAARKGERLSAAGERASRAAERLSRRMDEEAAEAGALVVRLSPVGEAAPAVTPPRARLELMTPARAEARGPVELENEPEAGAGEQP